MESSSRQQEFNGFNSSSSPDPNFSQEGAGKDHQVSSQSFLSSMSTPVTRPNNYLSSASVGAVPTQAALQAAGIIPAKTGEPSRPSTPPSTAINLDNNPSSSQPIPSTSTMNTPNDIAPPLPFSTSVPYSRTNFTENFQTSRPLSSDEAKSLSFSQAQSNKVRPNEIQEEASLGIENNSIPPEALFPSPSGGFVPPPDVDGQEWKLKEAPRALARGGPIEGEVSSDGRGEGSANFANAKEEAQPDRSQTPRGSTIVSTASRESLPPTRPPSLPPSSQTAELIATAPSSSTSSSASRRTSQASPSLRPISTNSLHSLSLSRSASHDKRRKSGLSTTSSQLSPTDSTSNNFRRQSFQLSDGTIVSTTSQNPSPLTFESASTSRPASVSNKSSRKASRSPPRERERVKDQPPPMSSDTTAVDTRQRPLSGFNTSVTDDRTNPASSTSASEVVESLSKKDSIRRSTFSSTSLHQDQQSESNENSSSASIRHSNINLPPLKVRDFAFPETDPRHVGARDLSIPEERLSTGYSGTGGFGGSGPAVDDDEEWGPEAHEHSYDDDDDEEDEEGAGALPEGLYQVVYPFDAESEHELSVTQGQKVQVVGALEGGWAIVQTILEDDQVAAAGVAETAAEGSRGLVPEAYLEWLGPI